MSRAPAAWRGLRLVQPASPAPEPEPTADRAAANDTGPIVFDSRPWRIAHGLISGLVVLVPLLMLLAIVGWIG